MHSSPVKNKPDVSEDLAAFVNNLLSDATCRPYPRLVFRIIPPARRPIMLFRILAVMSLLGLIGATVGAADVPALKKGERIVFLGDSITAGGVGPKGYVTVIKNALTDKHKDLDIQIIGKGISGNKVPDLQKRVDRDVISQKPTIVVIYIGINDVWHSTMNPPRGTPKEAYEAGLKEVIMKCTDAGARVILCTPTVIGEKPNGENKLDAMLDEYADISRKVAKDTKVQLCDLRKAFVDHLKTNNPDKKEKGILTGDTVHLSEAGNKLVAETILKCLGE
jgi:lysophospholipase L1-like esterase